MLSPRPGGVPRGDRGVDSPSYPIWGLGVDKRRCLRRIQGRCEATSCSDEDRKTG